MPLETLANIKSNLGVSTSADDTLLSQMQAAADAYIQTFCGRSFGGGTFTEYHPGGARLAFLSNFPVGTLTSVHVDVDRQYPADSLMPTSRYVLYPGRGVIECLDGAFVPSLPGWRVSDDAFPDAVRVVYTTPSGSVPGTILRAYSELVGHWYRTAKTHEATGQINVIEQAGTIYPWGQSTGYRVPSAIVDLLQMERVPKV
jgi:hypothetical protein